MDENDVVIYDGKDIILPKGLNILTPNAGKVQLNGAPISGIIEVLNASTWPPEDEIPGVLYVRTE